MGRSLSTKSDQFGYYNDLTELAGQQIDRAAARARTGEGDARTTGSEMR
jgi:hypothetical protein